MIEVSNGSMFIIFIIILEVSILAQANSASLLIIIGTRQNSFQVLNFRLQLLSKLMALGLPRPICVLSDVILNTMMMMMMMMMALNVAMEVHVADARVYLTSPIAHLNHPQCPWAAN